MNVILYKPAPVKVIDLTEPTAWDMILAALEVYHDE